MNINAQLVVDSLGRVGIGTETPKSMLSMGTNANEDATILCKTSDEENGLYLENNTSENHTNGAYVHTKNNLGHCFGMESSAEGYNTNFYQYAVGLVGMASTATFGVGVWGAPKAISSHLFCCRGVSITIEKDCRLIISEGLLENVILKPQPGSKIIIENGGRIKHNKDVNFKIPLGVTLEQNHGKIE